MRFTPATRGGKRVTLSAPPRPSLILPKIGAGWKARQVKFGLKI